jgi:glycosyltransferase involved in cell wall biosynthesis
MKILWICPFFLHPTDRGAQIRTLGMLKELHRRHEIHFAALNNPRNSEGPRRSGEYSSSHFYVEHSAPERRSLGIVPQLLRSVVSSMPMAVFRYASAQLRDVVTSRIATEEYDAIVCDFLAAAPNVGDLSQCVLLQHNVETTIFQRHVAQSRSAAKRAFFRIQTGKMEDYERKVCRAVKHVIAVSDVDAARMTEMFGIHNVSAIPTGVDVDYFAPHGDASPVSDIVFCGSMDWLPNVDAAVYFLGEIWPLIREALPDATFTIAGRSPDARVLKAAQGIDGVRVTGTVDDIRPYLWGSKISVVPIRIGGGTRLKIYECMAAGVPVVSTEIGAEGLRCIDGEDIVLAGDPGAIAGACIRLLKDPLARAAIARTARERVQREFSWEAVSWQLEEILERNHIHRSEIPAQGEP